MQKVIKLWFAFALSAGVLASCSQDGREPSVATDGGGETVTLSLSAEVSVEDPNLRAINYKLGKNSKDQLVPMPQFADKQEVEVHTIIKSSRGAQVVKTLKWRYDATKKKLVLTRDDGHSIEVSGFNNDNGVKWYISGLIGGVLIPNTTRVAFAGERVLKGVEGNEGDIVGSLNVPYAFGWTELTINTSDARDNNESHKYGFVSSTANVKFTPLGSLIAYKLGNAQTSGRYTFTPSGFTVATNVWGDQGEFELSTDIPTTNSEKSLPLWTESSCGSHMYYTFADGHRPGTIAHNGSANKTYYAWVISHTAQPTSAQVRVMLKGESSRPDKDYTKTYFTDYTTEGKTTQGRITEGKIQKMTANVTRRLAIPIEYVTEYNLAGGEGLTDHPILYFYDRPEHLPKMNGTEGSLRFASSHEFVESGLYSGYKVLGIHDFANNPDHKNLQVEVDNRFGARKYTIPSAEQWWGIYPEQKIGWVYNRQEPQMNTLERMSVTSGSEVFRQAYLSDYSASDVVEDFDDAAVIYAIRFKQRSQLDCSPSAYTWEYDESTGTHKTYLYPSALDNSMKCAYRFTRVGSEFSWRDPGAYRYQTNMIRIDVVYLGDEFSSTDLSTISDESWWSRQMSDGRVLSKNFSAGVYRVEGTDNEKGDWSWGEYASSSRARTVLWSFLVDRNALESGDTYSPHYLVRLFQYQIP